MHRLCLLLLALTPALADEVELTSGETVQGALIYQASDALHLLTREGEREFPPAEVARVTPSDEGVTDTLRRRAAHLGQRLAKQRAGHARSWLKRATKGSEERRQEALAAFQAFEGAARLSAAESAARDGVALELALAELVSARAVDPLLQVALGGKQQEAREAAHEAARSLDPDRAREAYTSVSHDAGVSPRTRYRALGHLAALRDPRALPQLEVLVLHLQQEVRTALAEAKASRTARVDLSGGNTSLPVELPEVHLIELNSTQRFTVIQALLRRAEDVQAALRALPPAPDPSER
ncbi:MAG: hypothetical protein R3F62_31945 [Planctomycetota bacterium]